jgi:hypothetical protein
VTSGGTFATALKLATVGVGTLLWLVVVPVVALFAEVLGGLRRLLFRRA